MTLFDQIAQLSLEITEAIPGHQCPQPPQHSACDPPSLTLPPPANIVALLRSDTTRTATVEQISIHFRDTMKRLQSQIRSLFNETWAKVVALPRHEDMIPLERLGKELAKAYEAWYVQRHDALVNRLQSVVRLAKMHDDGNRECAGSTSDEKRFNFVRSSNDNS